MAARPSLRTGLAVACAILGLLPTTHFSLVLWTIYRTGSQNPPEGPLFLVIVWGALVVASVGLARSRKWGRWLLLCVLPVTAFVAAGWLLMCIVLSSKDNALLLYCILVLLVSPITWISSLQWRE